DLDINALGNRLRAPIPHHQHWQITKFSEYSRVCGAVTHYQYSRNIRVKVQRTGARCRTCHASTIFYRQQFDKVCACILNRHSRRIQRIITHLAVAPLKRSQQRDTSRGGDCAATRYEQQKESAKCEVLSKKSHSGSKGDPVWPSAEFPHSSVKTQHPV